MMATYNPEACWLGFIFVEPASHRNALLVCTAPDDSKFDGALTEVITDAQRRGSYLRYSCRMSMARCSRIGCVSGGANQRTMSGFWEVLERVSRVEQPGLRFKVARAWAQDLVEQPDVSVAQLSEAFQNLIPTHRVARALLVAAALEGSQFHPASVGFA